MSVPLGIAGAIILTSLLMLALVLRRRGPELRRRVCSYVATLNLGFALLVPVLVPPGPVGTSTQLVFLAGAIWFMVLDWRLGRQR